MCNENRRFDNMKSVVTLLVTLLSAIACSNGQSHPDNYAPDASDTSVQQAVDPCALPKEGCPCSDPGEIVDCGQIVVKVDDYVTCFEGSRLCDATGVWGNCQPDQVIAGGG